MKTVMTAGGNLSGDVNQLDAETKVLLEQAAMIIGKVVADNLMPDIAMPKFPRVVLEKIEARLQR